MCVDVACVLIFLCLVYLSFNYQVVDSEEDDDTVYVIAENEKVIGE